MGGHGGWQGNIMCRKSHPGAFMSTPKHRIGLQSKGSCCLQDQPCRRSNTFHTEHLNFYLCFPSTVCFPWVHSISVTVSVFTQHRGAEQFEPGRTPPKLILNVYHLLREKHTCPHTIERGWEQTLNILVSHRPQQGACCQRKSHCYAGSC